MSSTSNISSSPTEEEEILASRGFGSNVITLRGYSQYGYEDRSRDVLSAVDIWDLELQIFVKDKAYRDHIIYDYPEDRIPVLGSGNQVMMIPKDRHYYDNQLLYLPLRLTGKRYHHVVESELSIYETESREEGVYWVGDIPGSTPVSELLEKISSYMIQTCHLFEEDHELNAKSEINNNNPRSEDIEIFYKAVPQCNKWDCPLCLQLPKFLQAHAQASKKARDWFLVGLRFDHPESIRYDHLKGLEPLVEQLKLLSRVMEVNFAIWDSWAKIDGKLDN